MKRTIEIEDNLESTLSNCQDEVRSLMFDYLKENTEKDEIDDADVPCLSNDLDYDGRFHEIIDSSVPIYTYEIDGLWFLYKQDFIEAYENAGCGEDPTENNGMTAIYFYLYEQVCSWYENEKDELLDEWKTEQTDNNKINMSEDYMKSYLFDACHMNDSQIQAIKKAVNNYRFFVKFVNEIISLYDKVGAVKPARILTEINILKRNIAKD